MRGSPASSEAVISDNLTADEEAAINIMNELGEAPEQDHDDSSDDVFEQEGVEVSPLWRNYARDCFRRLGQLLNQDAP